MVLLLLLPTLPAWEVEKEPEPPWREDPKVQETKGQEPDGSSGVSARETHEDLPGPTQSLLCPEGSGHVAQAPSCPFLGGKSERRELLSRRL